MEIVKSLILLLALVAAATFVLGTEESGGCSGGGSNNCGGGGCKSVTKIICGSTGSGNDDKGDICRALKDGPPDCPQKCPQPSDCVGPPLEGIGNSSLCYRLTLALLAQTECDPESAFYDKNLCRPTDRICCDKRCELLRKATGYVKALGGLDKVEARCGSKFNLTCAYTETKREQNEDCCCEDSKCEPSGCPCVLPPPPSPTPPPTTTTT